MGTKLALVNSTLVSVRWALFFSLMRRRVVITLTVLGVLELPVGCITTFTLKFESYNQAIYKTLLYARRSMTCVVPCIKLKGALQMALHQDVHKRAVGSTISQCV